MTSRRLALLSPGGSRGISDEAIPVTVVAGQAAGVGCDPQPTERVGVQLLDDVVGQRTRERKDRRLIAAEAIAVPARQAALRADPEKTFAVLGERRGSGGIRQLVVAREVLENNIGQRGPTLLGGSWTCVGRDLGGSSPGAGGNQPRQGHQEPARKFHERAHRLDHRGAIVLPRRGRRTQTREECVLHHGVTISTTMWAHRRLDLPAAAHNLLDLIMRSRSPVLVAQGTARVPAECARTARSRRHGVFRGPQVGAGVMSKSKVLRNSLILLTLGMSVPAVWAAENPRTVGQLDAPIQTAPTPPRPHVLDLKSRTFARHDGGADRRGDPQSG